MLQKKILIVDDSEFYIKCISDILIGAGYLVVCAGCGEEGLRLVRKEKPDMVLLDVVMPDIDGFEVCRILRESESNNLMPIIMLTSQDQQEHKLIGLELGADDYIVKPFNQRELLSRVVNTLRRIDRNRGASPLTGLPGNLEIQREINSRLEKKSGFAAAYLDLDNFKAYNDVYGFAQGDIAIKMTADIMTDQIALHGSESDFVGHIGGDDLFLIAQPDNIDAICQGIIEQFDQRIRTIYSREDLERGFISTLNRNGVVAEFPIMTISIAVVHDRECELKCHLQVAEIAAEVKKIAKSIPGSIYIKDRRRHSA